MKKKKEQEAAHQVTIETAPQTIETKSDNDTGFKELSHE